jgi:hypothetical protein
MVSRNLIRFTFVRTALLAWAIAACAMFNSNLINGVVRAQAPAQSGPNRHVEGQVPQGWQPGSGTIITGDDADKAKAAALGKYPGGTVNRVLRLSDGAYAVHMIKIQWPHHVFVNKSFEVTGAIG